MTGTLKDDVAEDDIPAKERLRDAAIQRVRVGIMGLAAVFLLTLLAASIFGMLGQDDRSAKLGNVAPKEPLAELGVAPGGNTPKPATPSAATSPASNPPAAIATAPPYPAPANGAAPLSNQH